MILPTTDAFSFSESDREASSSSNTMVFRYRATIPSTVCCRASGGGGPVAGEACGAEVMDMEPGFGAFVFGRANHTKSAIRAAEPTPIAIIRFDMAASLNQVPA